MRIKFATTLLVEACEEELLVLLEVVHNSIVKEDKNSANIIHNDLVLVEDRKRTNLDYDLMHNLVQCFLKKLSTYSMLLRKGEDVANSMNLGTLRM